MSYESKMSILNSTLQLTPQGQTFHPFEYLPKELRLQIWEEAVPRERLIRVHLKLPVERPHNLPPRYLEKNHLGNPISGRRYKAIAKGHQTNSKFLRVNKEAREVALALYRVHMPFYFTVPGTNQAEEMTLYLSPEHDILHIGASAPVKETLIDFFWDMKAYDPKGVGLVKIAFDLHGFCGHDLQYLKPSDLLLIRQRNALIETLTQLQEVWFVYVENERPWPANGRQGVCHMPGTGASYGSRVNFNTDSRVTTSPSNVPIASSISTFDRVGSDPRRSAETDLGCLNMGKIDPRELIWRWKRLLRTWAIPQQPEQVAYRLLVGQRPVVRQKPWLLRTVDEAKEFISIKEREREQAVAVKVGCEEEVCRGKTTAVGYWLFPAEALGSVGEGEGLQDMDFQPCRFLDMRNCWPELLLSRIG